MKNIIRQLTDRCRMLEAAIRKIDQELKDMPPGRLRLSKHGQSPYYYQIFEEQESVTKKYLRVTEQSLIHKLAQKQFLERLLSASLRELDAINAFLKSGTLFSADHVFENLHETRKTLVQPILLDDDTFAKLWQQVPFEPNPAFPEELRYATKRGEMVRSKAEAMFADTYYDMGIPYKYDYPVQLANGEVRYVDFFLLKKSTREMFYHEHLGMLDNPNYLRKNMKKINLYRQSGIFVGKNLILTHEMENSPLNMPLFRKNIKEIFDC